MLFFKFFKKEAFMLETATNKLNKLRDLLQNAQKGKTRGKGFIQ